MQTIVLNITDGNLVESTLDTGSATGVVDLEPSIVYGDGAANDEVIDTLMTSIVDRYGEAFEHLGREPRP